MEKRFERVRRVRRLRREELKEEDKVGYNSEK